MSHFNFPAGLHPGNGYQPSYFLGGPTLPPPIVPITYNWSPAFSTGHSTDPLSNTPPSSTPDLLQRHTVTTTPGISHTYNNRFFEDISRTTQKSTLQPHLAMLAMIDRSITYQTDNPFDGLYRKGNSAPEFHYPVFDHLSDPAYYSRINALTAEYVHPDRSLFTFEDRMFASLNARIHAAAAPTLVVATRGLSRDFTRSLTCGQLLGNSHTIRPDERVEYRDAEERISSGTIVALPSRSEQMREAAALFLNSAYRQQMASAVASEQLRQEQPLGFELVRAGLDFERVVQVNLLFPNLSRSYDLRLPELPNGRIGFVNGIWNSARDALNSSNMFSSYTGGYNVHSVYNASTGPLADILKVKLGMIDPSGTTTVVELHRTWNEFFSSAKPNERFLQFCHSGGATQLKLALRSFPTELRTRIEVVAVAPATYIQDTLCYSVRHYVSRNDFVPRIDKTGRAQCAHTVVELEPHPDVSRLNRIANLDHGIDSPTYREPILRHIRRFIQQMETQ